MKKIYFLLVLASFNPCFAQQSINDSISDYYESEIQKIVASRNQVATNLTKQAERTTLNPYYFRMFTPSTYYGSSMHQLMGIDWTSSEGADLAALDSQSDDASLQANESANSALAQFYVNNPTLVQRTEEALNETPALLKETTTPVEVVIEPKLAEQAVAVNLDADVTEDIAVVVKKPNFWKLTGSASLQFTQSYFSENWYQGGENNYSGIGMGTLEANYDNKQKIQWDNKLEAQLGFQTTTNDYRKLRVTSNLLRLTSKLGYKAVKNWFYTGQVMTYTQIAPYYDKEARKDGQDKAQNPWKSRFGTPWYLTLSVGMDYKYKSKNGKYDLSVYLSPVAYYMTYVDKIKATIGTTYEPHYYDNMYGIKKENKGLYRTHSFHKFGPNLTVNSKVQIMKNVLWTSRFYWFSNFHSTLFEWENTIDFTINKYLSAKFYAYPRFDDSNHKNRDTSKTADNFLMFKEWLSLGISYKF